MKIEGLLLAGGKSRRMGRDKAALLVDGEPLAKRIADELSRACVRVTVLGGKPIEGHSHQPDLEMLAGPLAALASFSPQEDLAFVASCDLPKFSSAAVSALARLLQDADAAIPVLEGRPQPLCAIYRSTVFESFRKSFESGERAMLNAFAGVNVRFIDEIELSSSGVDPICVRGVNTPEELTVVLKSEE